MYLLVVTPNSESTCTRGPTIFHVNVQLYGKSKDLAGQRALVEKVTRLVVARLP